MSQIDRVDELARQVFPSPAPTAEDRRYAEQRMEAAIGAASTPRRRVSAVSAVAAALAVTMVASVWVLSVFPRPATAALEEIAAAIEHGPIEVASGDEFLYVDVSSKALGVLPRDALGELDHPAEHFTYIAVLRRETWYRSDGARQVRTTVHPPQFLRPGDRQVYYAAGLDEVDRVGETYVETFPDVDQPDWPQQPDRLHDAIEEAMAEGRGLSHDVEYLDVALDVVRDAAAAPELRAEALRLIGRLSEVEMVEQTPDGTATFRTRYVLNDTDTEHVFSIDAAGHLVRDVATVVTDDSPLQLPAGTTIHEITINDRATVESLSAP